MATSNEFEINEISSLSNLLVVNFGIISISSIRFIFRYYSEDDTSVMNNLDTKVDEIENEYPDNYHIFKYENYENGFYRGIIVSKDSIRSF